MQSQQHMAQMAAMTANNGPVDGTPIMGNMAHTKRITTDPREQLNTYIYDYFLRNEHFQLARAMLESPGMKMSTGQPMKPSPNNRLNGADPLGQDEEFPAPQLPANQMADNSFLLDWWVQFWDIYQATKTRNVNSKGAVQYIQHTRNLAQMQNEQRNQRMMMTNPMNAQYQPGLMRGNLPNGVAPNDLQRKAAMNNRPNGNPMAGMPIKNPMMAAHMQRDPSGMDVNGQRPQSPGSNENAPSPNKRPRVEGGMNPSNMQGGQFGEFAQPGQNAQQPKVEGMNSASPMPQGLEEQNDIFAGNGPRPGMTTNPPGPPTQGNHALQDYQMQLMLLEQQNKKRLLMARQEQDNMSGPHQQPPGGGPAFGTGMSPSRAVPSPNPADPRNRGTPKLGQQGPGSPMPEGAMQQQRGSPAPNMGFDPGLAPPGMPPQFYQQVPQNPMMRPPSSHPNANFNNQQLTPQQIDAMRNQAQMQQNGVWRGGPPQPGMMPNQQMSGPMGPNAQQRTMPPPPAPAEQPRPEPSPSQSNQAPPTPQQGNKAGPKKKPTKDNKKPANKKGANTGATPAATNGEEPPTPTSSTPVAPITPVHTKSFNQAPNGGPQQNVQPQPPQQQQQQQPPMDSTPFGNIDADSGFGMDLGFADDAGALENFDFDSFLHTGNENDTFGLVGDFDFNNATEVGGEM